MNGWKFTNKKYWLMVLAGSLLVSCGYKKDYNPTFWNYTVLSENNSKYNINNFRVEKKGYERLLAMHIVLWPGQSRSDLHTNIPISGIVEATWAVSGKKYSQDIDLSKFNIRSKKSGSLVFKFTDINTVEVTVTE